MFLLLHVFVHFCIKSAYLNEKHAENLAIKLKFSKVFIVRSEVLSGSDRGLLSGRTTSPLESSVASGESSEVKDVAMTSSMVKVDGLDVGYHVIHPSSDEDWKEPSLFEVASTSSNVGGKSAMLEAFHQFQHNPQVQVCID